MVPMKNKRCVSGRVGFRQIYVGVCIDTACTLGVCAERNAIFNMITNVEDAIRRVIAVNWKGEAIPPCGACREFMAQLMPEDYRSIEIMMDYEKEKSGNTGGSDARMVAVRIDQNRGM